MADIKTIGVVGCGTMGTGIAIVAARAGFKTRLYDTRPTALDQARKQAAAFLQKSLHGANCLRAKTRKSWPACSPQQISKSYLTAT